MPLTTYESSYGENTDANVTIRAIPWASNYTVVVQSGGSMPVTRSYRAMVYSEDDYLNLRGQRGAIGNLLTPREQVRPAILTNCKRGDMQDPNGWDKGKVTTGTATGFIPISGVQSIELTFTMLT